MTYHLEVEIEGLPATYNKISRKHWAVKVKEAQKWKDLVKIYTNGKLPKKPLDKALIKFTRVSSACPDSDGLVSGFKHVQDGLINAGVIVNDRYENIGMPEYRWEKCGAGKGKIKIEVTEI